VALLGHGRALFRMTTGRSRTRADGVRRFVRFAGIGAVNTAVHVAVVVVLVELVGFGSVAANVSAFIVANTFSFWANSRWTFRASLSARRYSRFLVVSLLGLGVTAAASGFANWMNWHYLVGTLLVFCTLPVLTFTAHQAWTWSDHHNAAGRP
jgi:putative flippase GtrA